jgi:hypothetical protein
MAARIALRRPAARHPLRQAAADPRHCLRVPLRDALAILLAIDVNDEERFDQTAVRWAGRVARDVRDLTLKGWPARLSRWWRCPTRTRSGHCRR